MKSSEILERIESVRKVPSGTRLFRIGPPIAKVLAEDTTLNSLDLSHSCLLELEAFTELMKSKTIRSLHLDNMSFPYGAARILGLNTTIIALKISCNRMEASEVENMVKNTVLTCLDLHNVTIVGLKTHTLANHPSLVKLDIAPYAKLQEDQIELFIKNTRLTSLSIRTTFDICDNFMPASRARLLHQADRCIAENKKRPERQFLSALVLIATATQNDNQLSFLIKLPRDILQIIFLELSRMCNIPKSKSSIDSTVRFFLSFDRQKLKTIITEAISAGDKNVVHNKGERTYLVNSK